LAGALPNVNQLLLRRVSSPAESFFTPASESEAAMKNDSEDSLADHRHEAEGLLAMSTAVAQTLPATLEASPGRRHRQHEHRRQ
jgi:hypothetical protein